MFQNITLIGTTGRLALQLRQDGQEVDPAGRFLGGYFLLADDPTVARAMRVMRLHSTVPCFAGNPGHAMITQLAPHAPHRATPTAFPDRKIRDISIVR